MNAVLLLLYNTFVNCSQCL